MPPLELHELYAPREEPEGEGPLAVLAAIFGMFAVIGPVMFLYGVFG